jgi:hypothetical protein
MNMLIYSYMNVLIRYLSLTKAIYHHMLPD